MNDIENFDEWYKKLAVQSGISYQLVFKNHLRQIKNNWHVFDDEIADTINDVMVLLLKHGLTCLLIELAPLLASKMDKGRLLLLRIKMNINCGIAFNMQNKLPEAELLYNESLLLANDLIAKDEREVSNIFGSIYYNYARLYVSKNEPPPKGFLENAVQYFEKGGYKPGLACCFSLQAVLLPAEQSEMRIKLFLKAAELNKSENMPNEYAMRLANVGVEFVNVGDFKNGIHYLNLALDINLQNGSAHHVGMNYLMLADAVFKQGELLKAKTFCDFAERELAKANIASYNAEIEKLRASIEAT